MQAYRTSTKLKLGLIAAAVAISVASLLFTQRLADRLEVQDAAAVDLWAAALEFQYQSQVGLSAQTAAPWDDLERAVAESNLPASERARLLTSLDSLYVPAVGDILEGPVRDGESVFQRYPEARANRGWGDGLPVSVRADTVEVSLADARRRYNGLCDRTAAPVPRLPGADG